ncbi:MAG TPA: hypothetical protein VFZ52_11685 [Chryseolinea sp.]
MIEVFKTDVNSQDDARILVDRIHCVFEHCRANFDLQDCDKILRVMGIKGEAETWQIVSLVKSYGWRAEILTDDNFVDGELPRNLLIDDAKLGT